MIEENLKTYQAKCKDCTKVFPVLMEEWRAEQQAEDHMMETGHIVDVEVS